MNNIIQRARVVFDGLLSGEFGRAWRHFGHLCLARRKARTRAGLYIREPHSTGKFAGLDNRNSLTTVLFVDF